MITYKLYKRSMCNGEVLITPLLLASSKDINKIHESRSAHAEHSGYTPCYAKYEIIEHKDIQ